MGTADDGAEMSRREFLNYAWLATLGILTVELMVVTYLFSLPRLGPGEFGGPVPIGSVDSLPGVGAEPEAFRKAKFWWVQTELGALALYKVCTHLGCIYDWKPDQTKFICPCHGSQFAREGMYLAGPAPRSLDRFVIRAYDSNNALVAETPPDGAPVEIPPGSNLVVETGMRIPGQSKA
jgi:cytochrome b6-f complex iron-sulfur subunit